jgi:hypothetical protein
MRMGLVLLALLAVCWADDALNLSRYLSSPNVGRNLSRVALPPPFAALESYSGLFEISPGRFTFFWYVQTGGAAHVSPRT